MSERKSSRIMVRAGSRSARSAVRSSLRKKSFGRHSERSEESLLIQNKSLREILRAKSALRMTVFRLFPQTVRWVFALATLAALVFVPAGPSRAQSQGTASKSAPANATTPAKIAVVDTATVTQATTPNPAAQPAAPAGQSTPKGQQEGIKIHGHWTIEVRNPDGTLVTHREFENGLYGAPNGGAVLLAGILGGAVTTGSWHVILSEITESDVIEIAQPSSAAAAECANYLKILAGSGRVGSCSNNLTVAGASLVTAGTISGGLTGSTVTFTGTGTVPTGFGAAIGQVATENFPCLPSDSPTACFNDPNAGIVTLTTRNLDSVGSDPAPVPVTAGQSVSVTVVLSFM